ncbi:hypothetical protein C882_4333 [Caenispirillum salinarum AK4]|uniref:Lipoprotein n=1 Tax=Caenispirillum salinarum AK4 TaxID=1238182 RepID=K9H007_9PROT|nr:hypothetical protein [Caenispirillum salinarum]EKV30374.1 hypothetical protein C882_4333 [Caenispirillum salinarum AK4]
MTFRLIAAGLTLGLLTACNTTGVEEQPVAATEVPAAEYTAPVEGHTVSRTRGSVEDAVVVTVTEVTPETFAWRVDNSCHGRSLTDAAYFAPNLEWNDCGDGAWASGTGEITGSSGSLWPLSVGKTASWDYVHTNSRGDADRNTRRCEVEDTARVTVPAGTFDTFKVVCNDRWRTRTFYYAPEVNNVVREVHWHKRRNAVVRDQQLVKVGGTGA